MGPKSRPPKSQQKLLSPTNDVVAKMLMVAFHKNGLLPYLLNSLLHPKIHIETLDILNPEIPREMLTTKGSLLDTLAKAQDQALIHIEIQDRYQPCYLHRIYYYAHKAFNNQLLAGDEFEKLQPIHSIHICNFRVFDDEYPDNYIHTFRIQNEGEGPDYPRLGYIHIFELPKFLAFMKKYPQGSGHTSQDACLQFFADPTDQRMERYMEIEPNIRALMSQLKKISNDPKAQELARLREKAQHDWATSIKAARDEGEAEGRAEGEAKGRAEGEAKGRAEGRAEGEAEGLARAKQDMLKAMLLEPESSKLPDAVIATITGFSVVEVTAMRTSLRTKRR